MNDAELFLRNVKYQAKNADVLYVRAQDESNCEVDGCITTCETYLEWDKEYVSLCDKHMRQLFALWWKDGLARHRRKTLMMNGDHA